MKDTLVFDIETQKSFDEVGGRDNLHLLGISVLAVYSYNHNKSFVFDENNITQFQKILDGAETLIGFNSNGFDVPILKYNNFDLGNIYSLDLMDEVKSGAGFRISLDNIASATLGINKIADGLQAIRWYKEGNIADIKKYCVSDVSITREVYEYGKKNNHIFFVNREKAKIAIPVNWSKERPKNIREILAEAFKSRKSVEIDYITHTPIKSSEAKNSRLIDIYSINNSLIEAFCHLRQGDRVFKLERIVNAKITKNSYKISTDVQKTLL